jgi:hypothetical protein
MGNEPGIEAPKKLTAAECLGLLALASLALVFIATSWRKWPDPLIDFGRELYVPWRLANGALLYRDVAEEYGPLSQYFNAALFKLFGTSLMVLVTANLAIFAAISALIYSLSRRAWGAGAALVACAVFISVFGFSQFVRVGNYNYATPYAHEATHGFLICLLLACTLARWVEKPKPCRTFISGMLFGLATLLKPEIMLAAGLITVAAAALQWWLHKQVRLPDIALWAMGSLLPSLGFVFYFAGRLPLEEAFRASCSVWLHPPAPSRVTSDPSQMAFIGFDFPWQHLKEHAMATLYACVLIAFIAGAALLAERARRGKSRLLIGGLLTAVLFWLACFEITWLETGRCLLGLMLIYLVITASPLIRKSIPHSARPVEVTRFLLALLATALMARMVLNGRIYHYGFCQAALAAVLVPAILIGDMPLRLGMGRGERIIVIAGSLALLVPGVLKLAGESQRLLGLKTLAIGEGMDQFYAFPPQLESTGDLVRAVSESLSKQPRARTLVVVPEGVMINYLVRMPAPIPAFLYFSDAIKQGREAKVVGELQQHSPDRIVIISRDLREFGFERYGEKPGQGALIMNWVNENYEPVESIGCDPLDSQQRGATILKPK